MNSTTLAAEPIFERSERMGGHESRRAAAIAPGLGQSEAAHDVPGADRGAAVDAEEETRIF
jgi:hypothetical protein